VIGCGTKFSTHACQQQKQEQNQKNKNKTTKTTKEAQISGTINLIIGKLLFGTYCNRISQNVNKNS